MPSFISCLLDDLTLIQKEIRFRIHNLQWCIISVGRYYHHRINPICSFIISDSIQFLRKNRGRHGSMVVFFTTTHAIGAYYHQSCEFMARCKVVSSWRGVLYATLYDKVCQWLATVWWFSLGNPFSSTNKTDHHDIAECTLNTIKPTIGIIIKVIVGCIICNKHVSTHQ